MNPLTMARPRRDEESVSYLPERRWRRRLRAARPYLILLAVVAVLTTGAWVVMFSSVLGVQRVVVSGASRLTTDQVVRAAGVGEGSPLARVDLGAVVDRVEALPAVARATASRSWPHTVTITITERRPLASLHHDGDWWLMDSTGALFSASAALDHGYPIAAIRGRSPVQERAEVGAVLDSLPQQLRAEVHRVSAGSIDSIALTLDDGTLVRWGSSSQPRLKARVLATLMAAAGSAGKPGPGHRAAPKVYDVTVPQEPTTALR